MSSLKQQLYAWVLLILCVAPAHAVLDIEITQGVDSAIPAAVVPFSAEEGLSRPGQEIASIIQADLAMSGEFKLLDSDRMAQLPSRSSQVSYSYWKNLEIENLVIGEVLPTDTPDRYQVKVTLLDIFDPTGPALLTQAFVVERSGLRRLAHHISDLIYQRLTGYRGIFSTRIAYITVTWAGGKLANYELDIADVDGYNPRPLLKSKEPIMSPSWSPDGKKLAYVSFEKHRAEIYVSELATGKRQKISDAPGINGAPAWSPDGKKIALVLSHSQTPKIFVYDLQTKTMRQITRGGSIDTEPHWMPNGQQLLFTSNRGGQPQIYRVNLSDGAVSRLTFEGDYNARPSVTPDGRYLAMIHRSGSDFHIAVQDLKTGRMRILTQSALDESPTIAPNGRMIIYGAEEGGRGILSAVSIDGRVRLRIPTREGEVQEPAWSPFF